MTAATTIDTADRSSGRTERTSTRLAVALLVLLVAGVGVWGAGSTIQNVRAYEQTNRVEDAVAGARYALALERTAFRDPDTATARHGLSSGSAKFSSELDVLRASGTKSDVSLAAALAAREHQLRLTAAAALAAAGVSSPAATGSTFDRQASHLDAALAQALGEIRARSSDKWPARRDQRLELAAAALLGFLGLASAAVLLMRLAGYRRRLERQRRAELVRLEEAALTDNLTGLGNHRAFYDDLKREISRRARTGSCFTVVMLDLDELKQINDTLGHQAGDERIRGVAECLTATLRASDGAYRTGGDEFMALLADERAWGGLTFAQRLQAEVAKHPKPLSVSCGVVESAGLESADSIVRRADLALYEAKRTGRRIVVYSDGLGPRPTDRPEDLAARRHHRLLATALAQAVDAKDAGTRNHCETVSALCVLVGEALGLGGERIEQLRLAGLLHDVGKIGIADALLQKPRSLDADERRAMSGHVEIGHAIVTAAGLEDEARWILHHHEHVDGSGYPDGLVGSMIPLESRIILVADAFEAMTADRPYRAARKPAEALAEIEGRAGTQFDPACVEALRGVLDAEQPEAFTDGRARVGAAVTQTGVGESVFAMAPYKGPKVADPSHRKRESL